MAAHEEQSERVVLIRFILKIRCRRQIAGLYGCLGFPSPPRLLTAQIIRHAPRGNLNQPAARIVRNAFPRPLNSCRDQRLLNGVLGSGEIMETADYRAEHLRRQFAQQALGTGV